jgi:hypothetical protein
MRFAEILPNEPKLFSFADVPMTGLPDGLVSYQKNKFLSIIEVLA